VVLGTPLLASATTPIRWVPENGWYGEVFPVSTGPGVANADGDRGRGVYFETQGDIAVLTVMTYEADGRPVMLYAAGPMRYAGQCGGTDVTLTTQYRACLDADLFRVSGGVPLWQRGTANAPPRLAERVALLRRLRGAQPQPQPQPQPQETPTAEPEFTATPRPQNTATPVPPEIVFLPLPVNPISTSAPTPTHTSAPTPIAAPIITYIVELNNIVPTVYPRTGLTIEVKVCEGERGQTRCQADNPPLHNALVQYTDAEENIQFAVTDDSGKANLRNVKPRTVVIAQAIGYTGQIPGYVPADSNKTLDIIMIKEPIESYGGIWFVPLIPFLLIALLLIVVIFLSYMIYINNSRLSNFLRYAFMAVSSMIPAHNEMLLMLRFANLFNLYGVKIKNIYEIQLRYFSDKGCILTILGDDGNYILASDGAYKEYYHDITPKGVKKLTGLASYELSLAWNEMIRLKHIQSPITMIGAWYLFKEDNRAKPQKQHP
jgi:hypothetical protein